MPKPAKPQPRIIAWQLAQGFGTVTFVAVVMSAVLLGIIDDVAGLVSGMQHDESPIRQGFELATAVRDQSAHIAHSLIEADDSHLDHYEDSRRRVRSGIQELASGASTAERRRLERLGENTQRMHDLFMSSALEAARRGDRTEARRVHREIDALGLEAAGYADAIARSAESEMSHAHILATDSTRRGLLAGGAGALLIIALSIAFTFRLRASVLRPLKVLTDAAHGFGRGDFESRVGDVGEGEFGALGRAFDHMTEELALRQARLVQNERMAAIGQLAAGVAHELNNPIGIIRGYLKTMTPDGDPVVLREELAILDEEAAQCQRIAEDLLAYARAGELDMTTVTTAAFLEETARRYTESSRADDGEVAVDAEDIDIEVDRVRIRQVVLNLLINARQASSPDSPVTLRARRDGDYYQIDVEDHGPGVAPADRSRVFEPFFTRRPSGTGLGLSVVLGIVEAHWGTIEVLDTPAGGATFRVRLPVEQRGRSSIPVGEAA